MQKANLYIKDWLSIHPYTRQQPSDNYFVQLANRLFHICPLNEIPEAFKKKMTGTHIRMYRSLRIYA